MNNLNPYNQNDRNVEHHNRAVTNTNPYYRNNERYGQDRVAYYNPRYRSANSYCEERNTYPPLQPALKINLVSQPRIHTGQETSVNIGERKRLNIFPANPHINPDKNQMTNYDFYEKTWRAFLGRKTGERIHGTKIIKPFCLYSIWEDKKKTYQSTRFNNVLTNWIVDEFNNLNFKDKLINKKIYSITIKIFQEKLSISFHFNNGRKVTLVHEENSKFQDYDPINDAIKEIDSLASEDINLLSRTKSLIINSESSNIREGRLSGEKQLISQDKNLSKSKTDKSTVTLNLKSLIKAKISPSSNISNFFDFIEYCAKEIDLKFEKLVNGNFNSREEHLRRWMKRLRHNDAILFFNKTLQYGYLMPVRLLSILIKTYGCDRFASLESAEEIYKRLSELYPDLGKNDGENEFISNLMMSYVHRHEKELELERKYGFNLHNDKKEALRLMRKRIKDLYDQRPGLYTFNVYLRTLLEADAANRTKRGKKILDDYINNQRHEGIYGFDEWTYDSILLCKYQFEGYKKALDYFINDPIVREFPDCCSRVLDIVNRNNSQEIMSFYHEHFSETMKNHVYVQKKLILLCIANECYAQAWDVFENIKSPTQPIFYHIIAMLYKIGMPKEAIDLYDLALKKGFFPETQYSQDKKKISLDFHSYYVRGGGTPNSSSYLKIVEVIIHHFFRKIEQDNNNQVFRKIEQAYNNQELLLPIEFFTGRGAKGGTKTIVSNYLKEIFGCEPITPDYNDGMLTLKLTTRDIGKPRELLMLNQKITKNKNNPIKRFSNRFSNRVVNFIKQNQQKP